MDSSTSYLDHMCSLGIEGVTGAVRLTGIICTIGSSFSFFIIRRSDVTVNVEPNPTKTYFILQVPLPVSYTHLTLPTIYSV